MRYRLHGFTIESDGPLPAHGSTMRPDIRLRAYVCEPVSQDPMPGTVIFQAALLWTLTVTRTSDGCVEVLYAGHIRFLVDASLSDVDVFVASRDDAEVAQILLQGAVVSIVATLRGRHCLHATTVDLGGEAFALAGPSGVGKSTAAGMLVAEGASLLADDVTAIEWRQESSNPLAHPGLLELRFRVQASELQNLIQGTSRTTADARIAVRPERCLDVAKPLRAILFPLPSRTATEVRVDDVPADVAFVRLLGSARLIGWTDAAIGKQDFHAAASLAGSVRCATLTIPWHNPPSRDTSRQVADVLRSTFGLDSEAVD